MKRIIALLCITVALAGCSSWERTTYQTLAASQAAINDSQADYEARTIPHTACVYDLINKAKAADTVVVNSMVQYENVKGDSTKVKAAEDVVVGQLATLSATIAQIKTVTDPSVCGGK